MNKNFVSIESFRELDPRSRESMHDFLEIFVITMSAHGKPTKDELNIKL
jgi:hypothetical protein